MPESELLTPREVAARLKVGRTWVYERMRRGDFPYIRMGKYLRFRWAEVEAWLNQRAHGNPKPRRA